MYKASEDQPASQTVEEFEDIEAARASYYGQRGIFYAKRRPLNQECIGVALIIEGSVRRIIAKSGNSANQEYVW